MIFNDIGIVRMYNVVKLVLNYIKEKKGMSKYDDVAVFWNDVFDKKSVSFFI